jgi:hypothetical protein
MRDYDFKYLTVTTGIGPQAYIRHVEELWWSMEMVTKGLNRITLK